MKLNSEEAIGWLEYAEEDLRSAISLISGDGVSYRNACYLSQQTAEKAIKACYVLTNQVYDRSHNLNSLRNKLNGSWNWTQEFSDLSTLSFWATDSRYPGDVDEFTISEAETAIDEANRLLSAITSEIHNLIDKDKG